MGKNYKTMDGNTAAAYCAYAFSEVAAIYPITPSSTMAEVVDEWSQKGKKNIFNNKVKVAEMQSEAGAIGAVHGVLQAGGLATTFTASQGLLLMIPNIYKMVGELLPGVIHVAARSIATRSLSIFGDHQDIYAIRQTGIPILCSHSVQEVMDLAGIAHLSAIKAQVPFVHFFDGFRTSHEFQKIEVLDYDVFKQLLDYQALEKYRANALNPHTNPVVRGGAENDDIYFQGREAQNLHYDNVINVVESYMHEISAITGREYAPFTYYGAEDATMVIIAMGSVTETIMETIDTLTMQGEKVGLIKVHLYRPFSTKHLKLKLPKTVKKIAVLDRTKEMGSHEPLYLEVVEALKDCNIEILGGRYGLSSKDTTPAQIKAVYTHLNNPKRWNGFTIGIIDDVTNLSLPLEEFATDTNYTSCLFYGLGSDGTVSANKNAIKIIGDYTDQYVQAYFAYDSKKAGASTRSHLRFGKQPIRSTYYVKEADFISASMDTFLMQYDMLGNIKEGGTFLLNTSFSQDEIERFLPNRIKVQLAEKKCKFYIINASAIAQEIGIGRRTNTILQSAFFALNPHILPYNEAVEHLKAAVRYSYGKGGEEVVLANFKAIEAGEKQLVEIVVKPEWQSLNYNRKQKKEDHFSTYVEEINSLKGYELPVSTFTKENRLDGTLVPNMAFDEHRKIATQVPKWIPENCIQCGFCTFVCPHATIRAFLLNGEEIKNAPQDFETLKVLGKDVGELRFRIQVSPDNCVGCTLCVTECPGKGGKKALEMVNVEEMMPEAPLANYLYQKATYKTEYFSTDTVKGAQFAMPYFEVSAACAGCGETPYYRLASQLFGQDMLIANATGCSSIYCGSAPSTPFRTNEKGEGIAWGNSLFEDNAEYGYGMALAQNFKTARILQLMEENIDLVEVELAVLFKEYLEADNNRDLQREVVKKLVPALQNSTSEVAPLLLEMERDLISKSVWIIGGDGWAYDIGYGGLDHILANNLNVNVMILDTEVYSNTGGQSSKASQAASIAKFTAGGKTTGKKDIGQIMMTYEHIYIASIAMGANRAQTLKALKEAESYNGPSLIIAYSPCIEHGIKGGLSNHQQTQKKAVECGYWVLYRYDPRKEKPLMLDSRAPDFDKYIDFILSETRYSQLPKVQGESSYPLLEKSRNDAKRRYKRLVALATIQNED